MHYYFKRKDKANELQVTAVIPGEYQPLELIERADAILDDRLQFTKNQWPEHSNKAGIKLAISQAEAVKAIRRLGAQLILVE